MLCERASSKQQSVLPPPINIYSVSYQAEPRMLGSQNGYLLYLRINMNEDVIAFMVEQADKPLQDAELVMRNYKKCVLHQYCITLVAILAFALPAPMARLSIL